MRSVRIRRSSRRALEDVLAFAQADIARCGRYVDAHEGLAGVQWVMLLHLQTTTPLHNFLDVVLGEFHGGDLTGEYAVLVEVQDLSPSGGRGKRGPKIRVVLGPLNVVMRSAFS
jgi:hypothetical protein